MKNLQIFVSVLLVGCIILIISCSKEDVNTSTLPEENMIITDVPKFTLENGILNFPTVENYHETIKFISQMNYKEINDFFSSKGYSNLASKYINLFDELNEFEQDDELSLRTFVKNNSKYLYLNDRSNGDEELKTTTNNFFDYFANHDFIYKVKDVTIDVRRINNSVGARSCSNPHPAEYEKDVKWCGDDRLAKLKAESTASNAFDPDEDVLILNQMKLRGQKKIGCIYVNYKTNLEFITRPIIESIFQGTILNDPMSFGPLSSSCIDCYYLTSVSLTVAPPTGTIYLPNPNITSAHGEGSTRGIGTNTVELTCND